MAHGVTGAGAADLRDAIATELRRLHEDLLYTEKAHLSAAQGHGRTHVLLGLLSTVGAAIAAGGIIAEKQQALAGVAALVAAVASAVLTFRKPEEAAQQHLGAGRDLAALRVQVRQHLALDLHSDSLSDPAVWRSMVAAVSDAKAALDRSAPPITDASFERARRKIQGGDFEHQTGEV